MLGFMEWFPFSVRLVPLLTCSLRRPSSIESLHSSATVKNAVSGQLLFKVYEIELR